MELIIVAVSITICMCGIWAVGMAFEPSFPEKVSASLPHSRGWKRQTANIWTLQAGGSLWTVTLINPKRVIIELSLEDGGGWKWSTDNANQLKWLVDRL